MKSFVRLVEDIRACTKCSEHLPLGPRPVIQVHPKARILVVAQAPGTAVHATGIPFNDPSGDRLRNWMGLDKETFYDAEKIALVPMGFCYPGRGKGGDLPPRPECAPAWRAQLLSHLSQVELTMVIGRYAIDWHLRPSAASTLSQIVGGWQQHWPNIVPLPHPSPRNTRWLRRNPAVEAELVPRLRLRIATLLSSACQT